MIKIEFGSLTALTEFCLEWIEQTGAARHLKVKPEPAELPFSPGSVQKPTENVNKHTENINKPAEIVNKPGKTVNKPAENAPVPDEKFRVKVRSVLAALNKKTGKNTAAALIAETGFSRLTDVPLEALPELLKKAEEAMNG